MVIVTDVLWIEYPPFPSIATVYVPGDPEQDRVEVSDPPFSSLFEEREQVMLDDDGVAVSLTVAAKPFERVRVIVEVPVALPTISKVVGWALKSKSGRIAVPQMLLSTMPIANFSVVSPANPVVTYWNEISTIRPIVGRKQSQKTKTGWILRKRRTMRSLGNLLASMCPTPSRYSSS